MHVAGGIVIGIKKIGVLGNLGPIACKELFQDERFEKPGRVGEMPFRRTDIGHRLDDVIFRFKTRAQRAGKISDSMKTSQQAFNTCRARIQMRSFRRCRVGSGVSWGQAQRISPSCWSSSRRASSIWSWAASSSPSTTHCSPIVSSSSVPGRGMR